MVMGAHEETKRKTSQLGATKIASSTIRQEKKETPDVDKAHWEKQEQHESKTNRKRCSQNLPISRSCKKHIDQVPAEILNVLTKPLLVRNQAAGKPLLHSKVPLAQGILKIPKKLALRVAWVVMKWIVS